MFLNLTDDQIKTLQKYIANISEQNEFEIRFGKFVYNKEIKKNIFEPNVELDFFYNLKKTLNSQNFKKEHISTTEYIYKIDNKNIKKIVNNKDLSEQFVLKEPLMKYDIYDYDFRLALSSEKVISKPNIDENNFALIRKKERFTYFFQIGKLDLTIVQEIFGQKSNTKYEVEFEITQKDYNAIIGNIIFILQTRQNNFYVISNKERKYVIDQYKNLVNTYNFIGAQPETMHKNQLSHLYKELYSVTDKADGDRAFMFIDNNKHVYFIDNNMNKVYKTNVTSQAYNTTLIDGELIYHEHKIYFMAFDLIAYNGKDLRNDKAYLLKQRLDRLNHIISTITSNDLYNISMKKFYYKNVFLASEIILKTTGEKFYKNDGLIFTPMNEPYPTTKKWSTLLKWKPAELNTIDFYSINVGNNTWELYVQHVDKTEGEMQQKPKLALFDVDKLCKTPNEKIDGVTFRTSFEKNIIDPTTNEPFQSNTVIEYKWDSTNQQFVPLRTRWDKTANPRKHGNFSAVACDIWNNIHNPIEAELLYKFTTYNQKDFFFEKMRKFHNKVKEYLYNKYCNKTEYLLELCSGRGGDLQKWLYNDIKNVIGFDISDKNIAECQKRLSQVASHKINNYLFSQLDLSQESSKNIICNKYSENTFDIICCQFAIHYFFQSKSTLDNILDIINHNLKDDGYFIITFMDKNEITKLFNESSHNNLCFKEHNNEIVYLLNNYNESINESLYGNKIKISLNGNNILGEGSEEYIIDFDKFSELMKNNGYTIVETDLFRNVYNGFNKAFELQEAECDISFLNRYCVFKKGCSNNSVSNVEEVKINIPKKIIKDNINNELKNKYFVQNTIDLHKNNISLYMLNTKYDLIDLLNCIEYKYYKNMLNDKILESFDDIINIFEEYNIPYKPIYIEDIYKTLQISKDESTNKNMHNNLYFTYHKHIVEKKLGDDIETIEHDNWYIIMHKDKLLFEELYLHNTANLIKKSEPIELKTIESPKSTESIELLEYKEVLNILDNEKTNIKQLKEYLIKYDLKISGKKDELIERLRKFLLAVV